jgi:hypothetical protein
VLSEIPQIDLKFFPRQGTIIDFTITCPKPHHLTLRAAATEKEASKKNKYLRAYSIPQAKKYLVPWAMEASGPAGPKALQFTAQLAEWYSLHLGTKYVDNGSNTFTGRLWELLASAPTLTPSAANGWHSSALACKQATSPPARPPSPSVAASRRFP